MTALELFTTLRDLGVMLTPTCDYGDVPPGEDATRRSLVFGLHVKVPQGVLTDALRVAIREHKAALLELVEAFEERAAIAEMDGGLSRESSEALAWASLVQKEMVCQR